MLTTSFIRFCPDDFGIRSFTKLSNNERVLLGELMRVRKVLRYLRKSSSGTEISSVDAGVELDIRVRLTFQDDQNQ
jgi:hypothetical protein